MTAFELITRLKEEKNIDIKYSFHNWKRGRRLIIDRIQDMKYTTSSKDQAKAKAYLKELYGE